MLIKKSHWMGAWSASQVAPHESGISREGFKNQTIRMIVRPNASGSSMRIRFSNIFGTGPLTFDQVTVAAADKSADIFPDSLQKATFSKEPSVTLEPGKERFSDPISFDVKDGLNLAISIYISSGSGPTTWHPNSSQTTYISGNGNYTESAEPSAFSETVNSWFWLSGIDVCSASLQKPRVIVALGDSITDGYLSTPNENRRWTDVLNTRLNQTFQNQAFSILNQGISGNRILADSPIYGLKALSRLERDVFSQTGVTDLILLEGINDIGHSPHVLEADRIIAGIKTIALQASGRGIRVYVGTLTPFRAFKMGEYFTEEGEQTRKKVNHWIRTTTVLDGYIDFERAIADPDQPERILPPYDSGDHLHPSDAGLKAMADFIDLAVFNDPVHQK